MKRAEIEPEIVDSVLAEFGITEPTDMQRSAAVCLLNHLGLKLNAETPRELQSIHTRH